MSSIAIMAGHSLWVACLCLLWCSYTVLAAIQTGARFPQGLQLGEDANCSATTDSGYLRFLNGSVEYCNDSSWISVGGAQVVELNDLRDRVHVLENSIGSSVSVETMTTELVTANKLSRLTLCNKNGLYNPETYACECFCNGELGCFDSLRDCTECATGWTGEFCRTDIEAPVLTIVGNVEATHEAGTVYADPGATAWDNKEYDVTSKIVVDNQVDSFMVGTYTISYTITDEAGNSANAFRTVHVEDTTKPVIHVFGELPSVQEAGELYLPSVTVNVSDNVNILVTPTDDSSSFDFRVVGSFNVSYDAVDAEGNQADTVVVAHNVVDNTAPLLFINGRTVQYHQVGVEYEDAGAYATDNAVQAGDFNITSVSTVNANVTGNYTVTYYVTDDEGNDAVPVSREVRVRELAESCEHLYTLDSGRSDGEYMVYNNKNMYATYCMFTEGHGYDLLFNLNSTDGIIHSWGDTDFWQTDAVYGDSLLSNPLREDFKGGAFSNVRLADLKMIFRDESGAVVGTANYEMSCGSKGSSLLQLMQGPQKTITGTRISGSSTMDLVVNGDRPQTVYGDIFASRSEAIVVNKGSGWSACHNFNRMATTYSNSLYGHTFAGIGGSHRNGGSNCEAYDTQYESAPVVSYCDAIRGYGSSHQSNANPANGFCNNAAFKWVPITINLFATSQLPVGERSSCNQLYLEDNSVTDGTYTVGDSSQYDTYCSFRNGNGYDLLFNLDTTDSQVKGYDADTFWESTTVFGDASTPFSGDFKGGAYERVTGFREFMVVIHDGNGVEYGYARYEVSCAHRASSLLDMMTVMSDTTVTGTRFAGTGAGSLGLRHNNDRSQPLYGDLFLDHSHALVINKQSGWSACKNLNRIATTLSNTNYGHTFAGLGGWHENGCGSYVTKYDAAPISAYCDLHDAYGSATGTGHNPAIAICVNSGEFLWHPIHVSFYGVAS